jgi:nucleotide-binding universal stress UspA family protein
MAIRTIVVGTDLRASGERALGLARQTARSTGATLWLVHAMESEDESLDELERLRRLCEGDGLGAQTSCEAGEPGETILHSALSVKADLVAVGEPESSVGESERALGSTAAKVVQESPCSVLVACGRLRDDYRDALIAVGVDFAPHSIEAIRWARDVASAVGGRIALIHVESKGQPAGLPSAARAKLEQLVLSHGLGSQTSLHLAAGPVGPSLCRTADELGADLLFVGCRGQKRERGTTVGNTCEDCLRHSPVPVIAVRP